MLIFSVILLSIVALIFLLMIASYVGLWFRAFVSGTPIQLFNIIGMSLRKIPPKLIVDTRIMSYKAGLKQIGVQDLETHYLAGGKVLDVVQAMIAADKANIPLDWRQATAIDLAGRNIFEAVKTSVYPKVIDCPARKDGEWIVAVARDGIQLLCRARVTVRTNIAQLVGGATEETIIARVGEGIVTAIGQCKTHQEVLADPQLISELVLNKGLDAQTAYEILSIDIADINVGENIGARLREAQAKSDMEIARAKAEEKRAFAVATKQENEAKIPLAMAKAFEAGNLGIMQYTKLKNIEADTHMREQIGKEVRVD
ncbi:MAG: hypothetical protein K940chlam8_00423 [Chlamydiae bacterium]|nr:hypothetical protein [Chlamydiota bacterium]